MSITSARIAGFTGLVLLVLAGFWLADNNSSDDFEGLSVLSDDESRERSREGSGENYEDDIDGDAVIVQRESIVRNGDSREANRDSSAATQENTAQSGEQADPGLSQTSQDSAADEPEASSPPAAEILSAEVFSVISEVQTRFQDNQFEEGLNELNALYQRYDELNDFEKATVLNFYSNALLSDRRLPEAMLVFEQLLTVNNLRDDIRERALKSLGQLNMAEEQYDDSIRYFNQYLEINSSRDAVVLLGLANSHYSLQQYDQAIPYLVEHIQSLQAEGAEVTPSKFGLLATMAGLTENAELLALAQEFLNPRQ